VNAGDKVSVVIPTRGLSDMLANCLRSLAAQWPSLEVIVVEHETHDAKEILEETFPRGIYIEAFDKDAPDRGEDGPKGHSYSTLNNLGVAKATRPYILLLNNDVTARKGSIDAMVEVLEKDEQTGIVGAKLLTPKNKIQHIGVVFNHYGIPSHLGWGEEHARTFLPAWRSEYFDAVTFAAALIRRDLWEKLGGLSDDYFFNYEDSDFCLRARAEGFRCYVNQVAIFTHLEGGSGDLRTTEHHSIKRNLTVFRDKWIETGTLENLTGIRLTTGQGPLAMERLNVIMMPSGRGAGVSWWRMDLIGQKLVKRKLANVMFCFPDMKQDALMEAFGRADLAVIQGHHGGDLLRALRADRPFKTVFEHDDHPVYLSPYAEVYRTLGTQEIQLLGSDGSAIWLWRDGESGFDLDRNRAAKASLLETMGACDAMTTTTVPLAEYFSTISKHVFVLPNCVDFDHYPPVFDRYQRAGDDGVRVGWWGGDNHWHDMTAIGPWLRDFINAREDAKLVLIGAFYRGPFRGIDMAKVEDQQWVHVEAWPYKLATAGLDAAIIPLASPSQPYMQFNHFKSDIKWLEAAAYKIPCLVQAGVAPYENCIDGVNALTFASREEFLEKLDRLTKDSDLRRRLGQAAYDYAREYRDLEKNIESWLDIYQQVAKGEYIFEKKAKESEEAIPALGPALPAVEARGVRDAAS